MFDKKHVLKFFLKDKYECAERTVFGKWFQRNGAAQEKERKPFIPCYTMLIPCS